MYSKNRWGGDKGEIFSGLGSRGSMAERSAQISADIIANLNARTIVDIGCGDFAVSSRILELLKQKGIQVSYVGVDIARTVVERNRERFGVDGAIEFHQCNAARDPLPPGDVVILRQVCQHQSNAEVAAVLSNTDTYSNAIMVEHHPAPRLVKKWNLDKVTGSGVRTTAGSGIRPDLPPFDRRFRLLGKIPIDEPGAARKIDPADQEYLAIFYRGAGGAALNLVG